MRLITDEKFTLDQYTVLAEKAVLLSERLDPTSSKQLSYY